MLAVLLPCSAFGTDVIVSLTDGRLGIATANTTNRAVWIQRMSVPDATHPSVVIGGLITNLTDVNGQFVLSNLFNGLWTATVRAPPQQTLFKFYFSSTNLGTIYAADYLVADASSTYPAGAVAWAIPTSDNRYVHPTNTPTVGYVPVYAGGGNATWQGVVGSGNTVAAGTNIVIQTNGLVVTINNPSPTFAQTTNIAAAVTNNYTSITLSNPAVFINTNQIAAVTNRHVITNDSRAINLSNNQNTFGNINAGRITNTAIVFGDNQAGTWQIITNTDTTLTISNSSDGGLFVFDPTGLLTVPSSIVSGNIRASTAFFATSAGLGIGYIGDGRNLTNISATNLMGFVNITNLSGITSNQVDANSWTMATNRNGGNANFATNLTAGSTNQWRTDATNIATYYSNLVVLFAISETNGYTDIVRSNVSVYMHTNLLPGLTNLLATSNSLYVASNFLYSSGSSSANAIANANGRGTNTALYNLSITNTTTTLNAAFSNYVGGIRGTLSSGDSHDVILGGLDNLLGQNGTYSSIMGGHNNQIGFPNTGSYIANAVLGGDGNRIADDSSYNIAGGQGNLIGDTVSAGSGPMLGNIALGIQNNINGTEISYSVAIGAGNTVSGGTTTGAWALGRGATVAKDYSFVWSDGNSVSAGNSNAFYINATNGVSINTNNARGNALGVLGNVGVIGIVSSTNLSLNANLIVVRDTNFVDVADAGTPAANGGLYKFVGLQYTNANTGSMISNNGTVWIIKNSSFTSLYTSSSLISSNWTPVSGVNPSPSVSYGGVYKEGGEFHEGYGNFTNIGGIMTFAPGGVTNNGAFDNRGDLNNAGALTANSAVFTNTMIAPIANNIIYVRTNDINGLNYALTNLAVSTNKMMVGGGKIVLEPGTHYITTAFYYSNSWPASIEIEGMGIPGANVVYVGPQTNVNIFRFMGTHANDGVVLQTKFKGVGFYSVHDNTNWLVQLQETGWAMFDDCRFAWWVTATNNGSRGLGMAEELGVARATNMGGLYLGPTDTGAGITIRKCYFQFLQNGLYDASDHAYLEDNYFSLVGGATTGWPTNSPFRLGSAIIKTNGSGAISDSVYLKTHFTLDYICLWDHDNSSEPKSADYTRVEQCTYRFISAVPNARGSFVWRNSINAAPDGIAGIQGTTWAITNRAPPFMKLEGFSYGVGGTNLSMFPSPTAGEYISPDGNSFLTGTNNARAWYQHYNLDYFSFTVTGGETEVNGSYVFKTADWYNPTVAPLSRFFIYTNTVSTRTNLLVYDPSQTALVIVPWAIITQTNHVLDENILYYLVDDVVPPTTTWDPINGTSNNITVVAEYGKFTVNPNGSMLATLITNTSLSYTPTNTARFTILTNDFVFGTLYTNRPQRAWAQFGAILTTTNDGSGAIRWVVDQDADNTYESTDIEETLTISVGGTNSITAIRNLGVWLQPGARFYPTNTSVSPGTAVMRGSSSMWVFQ